eukprot:CAMPEP_0204119550 /NCGR_PEP_ID=MMETSP0361-20130328/7171_1 /ASSEMBLY_ACC=CAM_ASM_000343 /TAXON_ID=268821 /ORGANISM="Scrippsiella Hangoei, Strain SHTV-5" /LENGTH=70 /DNA_ID=CAMNT_0051070695 /DNA_START=148 /DNA_END=357 /DNA_ORIENTATION=+
MILNPSIRTPMDVLGGWHDANHDLRTVLTSNFHQKSTAARMEYSNTPPTLNPTQSARFSITSQTIKLHDL